MCDGAQVESRLEGTVQDSALSLRAKDGSELTGTIAGQQVTGTVLRSSFTAADVDPPAGLFRANVGLLDRVGWAAARGRRGAARARVHPDLGDRGWQVGSGAAGDAVTTAEVRTSIVLVPFALGAAVAVGLGVCGSVHAPQSAPVLWFSSPLPAKVWLTTGAVALALVQLLSALVIYGKLRGPGWSSCTASTRSASTRRRRAHSLLGCFFFGAFTTKMLLLTRRGVPGWARR